MHALERAHVAALARHLGWPAISITMPLHRPGADSQEDRIRFKNLLRSAEETLTAAGDRSADIRDLLAPARGLVDDASRWRAPGQGLAVFIAANEFEAFRLTHEPPEHVSVSDRFHVRPVLSELRPTHEFHVLALSQKRVRLFRGESESIQEMDLAGVPDSLAEALKYDDFESHLQFHSRTPAGASGRARRSAMFHGHGGSADTSKTEIERYLRMVDKGVHDLLRERREPLILAGVDYLLPIYHSVNTYAHLADASIVGNPDELSAVELHAKALEVLGPYFDGELVSDLARLEALTGTGGTSEDLREIVPAAHEGRVDVLFVKQMGHPDWGRFDPSDGRVELHPEPSPGDWDLADLAAAETLLHGGIVHALHASDAHERPAAIFRF